MQLRVFGCSFGWELWRCMILISDSTLVALVEAPVSPVFSSSSSTTRGSSEIRQQKSRVVVRNAPGGGGTPGLLPASLDRLKLVAFLYCGNVREKEGRLKTG